MRKRTVFKRLRFTNLTTKEKLMIHIDMLGYSDENTKVNGKYNDVWAQVIIRHLSLRNQNKL